MEASQVATCSACGGSSRDLACCEFCNANLTPGSPTAPTTCPFAPEGPFSAGGPVGLCPADPRAVGPWRRDRGAVANSLRGVG